MTRTLKLLGPFGAPAVHGSIRTAVQYTDRGTQYLIPAGGAKRSPQQIGYLEVPSQHQPHSFQPRDASNAHCVKRPRTDSDTE